MTCDDISQYVFVYLDREFGDAERVEFEAHLKMCETCRQEVQHERTFHQTFRSKLKRTPAPGYLRRQIEEQLDRVEPESNVNWLKTNLRGPSWIPLALAASLVLVVVWPFSKQTPSDPQSGEQLAVAGFGDAGNSYESSTRLAASPAMYSGRTTLAAFSQLPADVSGGAPVIREYMTSKVPFQVSEPLKPSQDLRLVGARLVTYQGQGAVLFFYEYKGERINVLQYRHAQRQPAGLKLERHETTTYGYWNRGGQSYLVSTEMIPRELTPILLR